MGFQSIKNQILSSIDTAKINNYSEFALYYRTNNTPDEHPKKTQRQ